MAWDTNPILGEDCIISVNTTGSTYVEVSNMHTVSRTSSRSVKKSFVFNRTAPLTSVSKTRDQQFTVDGYETPGDAGQAFINAQEAAGLPVKLKVLVNGVSGFIQSFRVSTYKQDIKADAGELNAMSYTLEGIDDAVSTGTDTYALL